MGTADKESKGLRILGRSESIKFFLDNIDQVSVSIKIFLDNIDQAIILNPTIVKGLSHPLNLF